jgi:hypothetical protein
MKVPVFFAACAVCLLAVSGLGAQTGTAPSNAQGSVAAPSATSAASGESPDGARTESIPSEYRDLSLGMAVDAAKEALQKDSLFGYRGERDVSLLPGENRSLIESSGLSFVTRTWLQFSDDKLYIMTFNLNPEKVDYYSIYSALVAKYGEPTSLDPKKAVWADDKNQLSLERPLTVKYIDLKTFQELLDVSGTAKTAADLAREDFINGF